jgi:hypothetical protein
MVSLSGTSISSPILGSVVFDVTFLHEASRRHETIRDIHAQVICSCIAVIISWPLIRANYLVHKSPLYFHETPHFKPDQSQPEVPVATLMTTRARCCGTQWHLMLVVSADDWPQVPQERWWPHIRAVHSPPLDWRDKSHSEGRIIEALCQEFIDIFSTAVRPLPAKVMLMVDRSKWELPCNRLP